MKWQRTIRNVGQVRLFSAGFDGRLLSVLLSILRSDPMVLDGLQGRYRLTVKAAKSLPDS